MKQLLAMMQKFTYSVIPMINIYQSSLKVDELICFSDEMIDSTSTLVRTESVKSRQSNNTTTSNDSVSDQHCQGDGFTNYCLASPEPTLLYH